MTLESNNNQQRQNSPEKPQVYVDTKKLLENLAQKIAQEYGIDISKVREFINSKTGNELGKLKSLVNSETGKQINIQELKTVIDGAKDVIEKASKEKIQVLKGTIDTSDLETKKDFYITQKIFSPDLLQRGQNPQNLGDQIIGSGIGVINSAESTVQLLYQIGSGVIQAPYHIYMIVTGKAQYDNFKNI